MLEKFFSGIRIVLPFLYEGIMIFIKMAAAAACSEEPQTMEPQDVPEEKGRDSEPYTKPICLIVLGMAGSGKTAFVQVSFAIEK